MMDLNCQFFTE